MAESTKFDDLLGGEPFTVELDAYVLPNDHTVWKCSPGKTYRFYKSVRDSNRVFPDIRGLQGLQGDPRTWGIDQIQKAVAQDRWARQVERIQRGLEPEGSEGVSKADREKSTYARRIWFEAKKGDLVVIPAEGYDKEVLIGELLTDAGDLNWTEAADGEHKDVYLGRPVAWKRSIPKFQLHGDLIKQLHTRAAVFALKESVKENVYRLAYKNFVYRNNFVAEFHTDKEPFTAEDSAVVATWLNGFDFLRHIMTEAPELGLPDQMSFYQMGLEPVPDSGAAELRVNIQSPGEIYVRSKGAFALALMAMLSLTGCSSHAVIDNGVTIEMKSVGLSDLSCSLEVQDTVNSMVKTMSYSRLDEANCLGARSEKDAKLSTRARLKHHHKKGT